MTDSRPYLIDSSAWIAFLTGRPQAAMIDKYLSHPDAIVVPTLVLYEVYRHLYRAIGEEQAFYHTTQLSDGLAVPLDSQLATFAAEISIEHRLGTADSVIYATALTHKALLVTLDNDFRGLPDCVVLK